MSALSSHPLFRVTPLAGVWIEIRETFFFKKSLVVTPLAGVWIEILLICRTILIYMSLPSRECGLKSLLNSVIYILGLVTPLAGVWIEMYQLILTLK